MEKDPATPLLVGRGFLATTNVVIDFKKAKIVVGEGVTRSIFRVKEIDLGDEEVSYWTTLGKRESYEPRPSTDEDGRIRRSYTYQSQGKYVGVERIDRKENRLE
ncbi:hypothetical protein Tco_1146566 [Tanacetum coccineum]